MTPESVPRGQMMGMQHFSPRKDQSMVQEAYENQLEREKYAKQLRQERDQPHDQRHHHHVHRHEPKGYQLDALQEFLNIRPIHLGKGAAPRHYHEPKQSSRINDSRTHQFYGY